MKIKSEHSILETERFFLREFRIDDAEMMYQLNLNPKVILYTGDVAFKNVAEAKHFLEYYADYSKYGYGRWAVIKKDTMQFIGWCGLKYNATDGETDIGFRFLEEEWNKGYATECARACIDYGFKYLKLKRIIGRAMKDNIGSIKVLENIGLVFERESDFDVSNRGVFYVVTL